MTDKPPRQSFPTAEQDVGTDRYQVTTEQTRSPSYRLAFADDEFLLEDNLRGVRLMLEFLKPERRMRDAGIHSTIVIFGSTRIRPTDSHNADVIVNGSGLLVLPGLIDLHAHPSTEPAQRGIREEHLVPEGILARAGIIEERSPRAVGSEEDGPTAGHRVGRRHRAVQLGYPTRHGARVPMFQDAAGAEPQRVFVVRHFRRRLVIVEPNLSASVSRS